MYFSLYSSSWNDSINTSNFNLMCVKSSSYSHRKHLDEIPKTRNSRYYFEIDATRYYFEIDATKSWDNNNHVNESTIILFHCLRSMMNKFDNSQYRKEIYLRRMFFFIWSKKSLLDKNKFLYTPNDLMIWGSSCVFKYESYTSIERFTNDIEIFFSFWIDVKKY